MILSNLPGRKSAGSKISPRLVAASTITPVLGAKPSSSASIWFRVLSRSSLAWKALARPRERPIVSISSIKMMLGALFFALPNRSRILAAPTPTNISINSDPDSEKKGTPASPATALASNVLPVPGGPTSNTPLGILAPNLR